MELIATHLLTERRSDCDGGDGDGDGAAAPGEGGADGDGEERDSRHGAASSRAELTRTRRASYTCSLDPITGASITFREPFTVRSTKV